MKLTDLLKVGYPLRLSVTNKGTFVTPQFNLSDADYKESPELRAHMEGIWPREEDLVNALQPQLAVDYSNSLKFGRSMTWVQYGQTKTAKIWCQFQIRVFHNTTIHSTWTYSGTQIEKAAVSYDGALVAVSIKEKSTGARELRIINVEKEKEVVLKSRSKGAIFSSSVGFTLDNRYVVFGTQNRRLHLVNALNGTIPKGWPIATGESVVTAITFIEGGKRFIATLESSSGQAKRYLVEYEPLGNVICIEPPEIEE